MAIYAIGDIHGELDLLRAAHARIAAHAGEDARIVHLGDLHDRGPDSKGVVDYLMEGQARGRDWVVLKGNHDRFLPKFVDEPEWIDPGLSSGRHWVHHPQLGAAATLRSYGIAADQELAALHEDAVRKVPRDHVDWLSALPTYLLQPEALFVHAGIRPQVELSQQVEQDLVWIRNGFLDDQTDHGVLVVHGHTPVSTPEHHGNRLAIDTGAVFGGFLSTIEFGGGQIRALTDDGLIPIEVMT